ncbi:MAG: flagellin [Burkholderiaceae bacterium]
MTTINTNVMSLNAQRNLMASQGSLATSMQRLSSGLRVNSAKDDAAGLAIAERMNAQVKGMNVAVRNANDGISLSQTAEGALGKVGDALQRMRELAVQSANGSNSDSDRTNLDAEYQQLAEEVTRVLASTRFNGQNLFDATGGDGAGTFTFQVGANNDANDQIDIDLSTALTTNGDITAVTGSDITSLANAQGAMDLLDTAIDTITTERATFGSIQNRFDSVISSLQVASENQSAARGRIMDADFAVETANLSRAQILQQAGTAMVAQANQIPQGVLSLLR